MSSLREIKDRIGSIRSTLKITGAMKLVASVKFRKAERALKALRPYESTLESMLADTLKSFAARPSSDFFPETDGLEDSFAEVSTLPEIDGSDSPFAADPSSLASSKSYRPKNASATLSGKAPALSDKEQELLDSLVSAKTAAGDKHSQGKIAVVALASNSSLCGSFNANVIRKVDSVLAYLDGNLDFFAVGRKIADPLRKAGFTSPTVPVFASAPSPVSSSVPHSLDPSDSSDSPRTPSSFLDLNNLSAHPSYEAATHLAAALNEACHSGKYAGVALVYNRFVSTTKQEVVLERYLPFETEGHAVSENSSADYAGYANDFAEEGPDYIFEPSAKKIIEKLMPQLLNLKLYSMLLNSVTAEHAARIIAMQTASDNAQDLLEELTLEYNKERQQQITSEILDIVGGAQQ